MVFSTELAILFWKHFPFHFGTFWTSPEVLADILFTIFRSFLAFEHPPLFRCLEGRQVGAKIDPNWCVGSSWTNMAPKTDF